jgi:methionyl-tRNA formyltransferase
MFGIDCQFTNAVRDELTALGIAPVAVLLAGHPGIEQPIRVNPPARSLPMLGQPTPVADVPVIRVGRLSSVPTIDLVTALEPDIIAVACFPRLIPAELTNIGRLAVNIHPSLLPQHRGPDPLFWIMRSGGAGLGVTIHELSERYDQGRIFAQRAVQYTDGARESQLEDHLARTGARLLTEVVQSFMNHALTATEQDARLTTYESWPSERDYSISSDRPVLHAWNFIRGVAEREVPIRVDTGDGSILVSDATAFGHCNRPPSPAANERFITFADGWLSVRLAR